ncbi:MAG: hypothetical protein HYX29_10915 [Solirubrobacterales bacterium]|nr:hypothetical protein [Solirubrobacterales bacterium]
MPAAASAAPEDIVAGAGKQWFSGSYGSVSGTNCSILGGSYSETMVSGFSGYGGAPSGSVVRVGDKYWASILVSVPGNQCPNGSDIVVTDLVMPPGTSYDNTRQIRCFSTTRFSGTWYESTNENWDMRPIGINAYGRTCPTGPVGSFSGSGIGFDGRGLANGQMFKMFVPVQTSQNLVGMGNSAHKFTWVVSPLASYGNFQTYTWANVFSAGSTSPFIYFARDPSVVPFWKTSAPLNQENMLEFFANLYSNFQPGNFCWDLFNGPNTSGSLNINCEALGGGWTSAVSNASDSWLITGPGPNGGATPFYFDYPGEYGQTFTLRFRFTPSSGPGAGTPIYSAPQTFKSLSGPDEDGDGVANDGTDQCPTQASTAPNGCPTSLASSDPDGDGVAGAKDQCPTFAMIGAANGCPVLAATFGRLPKFKRSKLGKGVKFPVTCSLDSPVKANLTVKSSVAKKLKLKVKKGAKTVAIGSASGSCAKTTGAKLKLKLSSKAKKPVSKSKKSISATLSVTFTPGGGVAPVTVTKSVKLG